MKNEVLLVDGACMEPALADGAPVLAVPGGPVRVGDVVAIRVSGRVTVHRVVARVGDRIVHQGDRGARAGVARVREVFGRVAPPRRFLRTPSAWLLMMGVWARHLVG